MKYAFLFSIVLFTNLQAFTQSFTVKGTVISEESEKPLPYAQVAFYPSGSDDISAGSTTDGQGEFSVQLAPGKYRFMVSFVGYEDFTRDIEVASEDANLGKIAISKNVEVMEEVTVEGDEVVRKPILTTMEGMEIRPDQTIANIGGTLLDILRNTPSVNVSDDGAVSLRGSGSTNVLIDGRNSALATDLEQIPASAIEKVQIINNPNARYDAESDGGVINIILKQGEDLGTKARAEVTTGTRWRTNANFNVSRKTEIFSIYGGYSYRNWPRVGRGETVRETYDNMERLKQFTADERHDKEHTVNYGTDYYWGQNKISFEGVFNTEKENDLEAISTTLTDMQTSENLLSYVRNNNESENNYTTDNALIYERSFDDKEQSLRALTSVSIRGQEEDQAIDVYNNALIPENRNPDRLERSHTNEFRNTSIVQIDYVQPLSIGKIETGYKSTFRNFLNDYTYEIYDEELEDFRNQDSISNQFDYSDQIHALYGIFSGEVGEFNYALGVRAEQTFVRSELINTNEVNTQQYLDFFPSVQADYALNEENTLKATYSRRIDRPNAWMLNPFPDFADSLNVRIGDPNLQPEYINSFELGHMLDLGRFNLTSNAFYRRIDGQVDWIVRVLDGISYRGPQNLNVSNLYGVELINTTEITDWWVVNASYSIFEVQVDGTNLDNSFTNRGLSWYAKLTTDVSLPWGINLQLTGNYFAPEIEAQGRDLARYYLDASLQKHFWDKQLSLSASFRDVFDTRNFAGENYGPDFFQSFEWKRETQILLLTASYTFRKEL
ncbi:TonB-dependent receptor [Marivirga sp. S37H4]|uniref:TonB-dependent receptor n=2 Tax=Marivirga aurantiaca TaxID=2802615 RepID=A0A934WV32_9BACT|nr:outer membrane beta-barrel family protein [Marivirga aurantiaca]MBK6263482.1 TonB-dependent receptor [Marivirga aurantiaca]